MVKKLRSGYFVSDGGNNPETVGNVAAVQYVSGWNIDSKGIPTGELHLMIEGLPRIGAFREQRERIEIGDGTNSEIEEGMSEGKMSREEARNHYFNTVGMCAMISAVYDAAKEYALRVTDEETAKSFASVAQDAFIGDSEISSQLREEAAKVYIDNLKGKIIIDGLAVTSLIKSVRPQLLDDEVGV